MKGLTNPNYRHGHSGTKLYWVWAGMIARCHDVSHKSYCDYQGHSERHVMERRFSVASITFTIEQRGME